MSSLDQLYKCSKKDMHNAGVSGADAFQDDPMWKAVLESEPSDKLSICLEMSLRHCRKYGAVYSSDESLEGLMAIVPGKYAEMTMWRMFVAGSFSLMGKMGSNLGNRMGTLFEPLMKDQKMHMQGRNYLYLFLLGVKKKRQGKGIGSSLLRALIKECDEKEIPIYLETETPENVQMYEHFGFKTLKETTLPVVDHPIWEMVKEPNT